MRETIVTGVRDNQQPDDLEAGEGVYMTQLYIFSHRKMAPTDMAALLLAPKQLCSNSFFVCAISYIISPERVLGYCIQLEITFGNQSGSNSPSLRSGIRLSRIVSPPDN